MLQFPPASRARAPTLYTPGVSDVPTVADKPVVVLVIGVPLPKPGSAPIQYSPPATPVCASVAGSVNDDDWVAPFGFTDADSAPTVGLTLSRPNVHVDACVEYTVITASPTPVAARLATHGSGLAATTVGFTQSTISAPSRNTDNVVGVAPTASSCALATENVNCNGADAGVTNGVPSAPFASIVTYVPAAT